MRRQLLCFPQLTILAAAVLVVSCQPSFHQKDERYVLVAANISLPYWQEADAGLQDAGKELGVKTEFRGPSRYEADAELAAFKAAVASNPSGILVSPARPEAFKSAIDDASQKGIPVICIDSDSPDSRRIAFIGTNNFRAGMESGQAIAQAMHEHGGLLVITIPGQFNLDERLRGVQEALKSQPYVQVSKVIDDQGDIQSARDQVSTLIQGGYHPDGILCLEASGGPGAAQALDKLEMGGKVAVVAMDANPETLDWIAKGVITSTVAQKPYTMSYYGVKLLDDLHHNIVHEFKDWKTAPASPLPSIIDTGTSVITNRNVEDYREALSRESPAKH